MEFKNDTLNEIVTGAKYGFILSTIIGTLLCAILYGPFTSNDPIKMITAIFLLIPMGVISGSLLNIFLPFAGFKEHPYKKSWSENHK